MKVLFLTPLLFIFTYLPTKAQDHPLPIYIQEALTSNISLKQRELSYEKSLAVLKEAKANFLPVLSFEARYSVARGGREIEIPVGDLVNPLYQNVNLINQVNQQAVPDYPTIPVYQNIDNESIQFLRPTEHDTKLRLVFPIYNAAILHNQRIRQNQAVVEKVSVEQYKKELVKEVKTAYFNYQKAIEGNRLYKEVLDLVQENLRTTQSLFRNHKITKDAVYRAESEVKGVEQQLAETVQQEAMARAFFNFLLNREYDTAIELAANSDEELLFPSLEAAQENALRQRDELIQLNHYLAISDNQIDLQKGNNLPSLNLVGDYGFQGSKYSFSAQDDYAMGSLVLSWSLFNRGNKAKIQQAKIDKSSVQSQKEQVRQQIGLQVVNAWYHTQTALQQIELTEKEIISARSAYDLVNKKFKQGQANLIELTDARTQWTNAQRKKIIAQFDLQVKLAELEWVMGK